MAINCSTETEGFEPLDRAYFFKGEAAYASIEDIFTSNVNITFYLKLV